MRLAMRMEGDNWVAYFVPSDTSMKDAIFLGSIAMRFVADNEERKQAFIRMMQESLSEIVPIEWPNPPVAAPEHERSKE